MMRGPVAGGLAVALWLGGAAAAQDVTVFAAASLKNALDAIGAAWAEETGMEAVVSYAASSALAKQIEEGAPADVFVSADVPWMDYLAERDLVKADSVVDLLGNRLVLVAPADSDAAVAIGPDFDLVGALGDGRLAMAQVDSVPAGKYGKEALASLGVWDAVEGHVAQTDNVRAALALVARGEAPFGIVYATDANAESAVKVVGTFPEDSHAPIIYPAAVTAGTASADAGAFMDFLRTNAAAALFEKHGFTVLAPVTAD
jgi:molybdate transport system substrate-binding protein